MESKCPKCETTVQEDDRFCGSCGFSIKKAEKYIAKTQVEMKASDIRLNLGIIYLKKGDYTQAIDAFQKVLLDDPDNPEAQELLTQAQNAIAVT